MAKKISVVVLTRNSQDLIEVSLDSVKKFADEIIVVDSGSTDRTINIAEKLGAKIFRKTNEALGTLRNYGLSKASTELILMLDPDEIVSGALSDEIKQIANKNNSFDGYLIPYQNHFLGLPLRYGGESYKILRLIKKSKAIITPAIVHEKFDQTGLKIGSLKGKIYHYSYRSLLQVFSKFTDYARRMAISRIKNDEELTLKKLFLYGPHMFWARFVEDKGYKDGLFRIPLDLAFAYMESLSYWLMLFVKK